ncbi:dockerin type I repeat-containing protein [Candidatus Marinimicrobia bacterium]|nr:dockerin type I repeat-containing protein [Candidatus Neomarinimicrobiota bacterium]
MNLACLLVSFSFIIAAQPIPLNINIAENAQLISSLNEISNRNCEECEYDYTNYGSECCDTAWFEYGVNCDALESIYFWDCAGCSCPGDEPIIDEESCEGEWIEDIEWASCNDLNPSMSNGVSYCNDSSTNTDQCYTYTCYGGSYGSWGTCCGGEDYQIDNSYCEEIEILDCSELNLNSCTSNSECQWVENIETGNCSDINNGAECYATNQCSWYNAGSYGYWYDNCYGGTYIYDSSYCEEIEFLLGDINGDSSINVLDIIEVINLILEGEYNLVVDMNYDHEVNVLDIVVIVDIILGN